MLYMGPGVFVLILTTTVVTGFVSLRAEDFPAFIASYLVGCAGIVALLLEAKHRKPNTHRTIKEIIFRKRCHDWDLENPIIFTEEAVITVTGIKGDTKGNYVDEFPVEVSRSTKDVYCWRCKTCGYEGLTGLDREDIAKIMTPGYPAREMGHGCPAIRPE